MTISKNYGTALIIFHVTAVDKKLVPAFSLGKNVFFLHPKDEIAE